MSSFFRLAAVSVCALTLFACASSKKDDPTTNPSDVKSDDPPPGQASAVTTSPGGAAPGGATTTPPSSDPAASKTSPATPAAPGAPAAPKPGVPAVPAAPGAPAVPGAPGAPNPDLPPPPNTNVPPPDQADPGAPDPGNVATMLATTLQGVTFVSEADFPWSVVVGDATGVTDITPSVVAERIGGAIAALNGGLGRDLSQLRVVANDGGYTAFLEDLASDPSDPGGPAYLAAEKLITANLQGTQVFFFDMNNRGTEITGPIITVVVGKTAANKLVAMVSFQVST
jgi:hypothetical protein